MTKISGQLPTSGSATPPLDITEVVYHVADGDELAATIYRPTGRKTLAGVISVHGGRWCSETRLTNAVIDRALAEAGIAVMAIDFRQPPAARYPGPVADINVAIRWLKHHSAEFGIDPATVGGVGTSSGGHQLILNALKPAFPSYASWRSTGPEDASVAFAALCWPVLDPYARYRFAIKQQMDLHVACHDAYWGNESAMLAGSPQRIVSEGEATNLPPILLIQGTVDDVLPADMADRFALAYRSAGGSLELEKYAGEPHTFITKFPRSGASKAAILRIAEFVIKRAAPGAASLSAKDAHGAQKLTRGEEHIGKGR
jgi:acetyl esterase/lipase